MMLLKPKGIDFPADRVREAFGMAPLDRRNRVLDLLPPGMNFFD